MVVSVGGDGLAVLIIAAFIVGVRIVFAILTG
jgi:hypothetical protein